MNPEHRERVKELLWQAARLPPSERASFIRAAADADGQVAAEALDLLPTLDDPAFMAAPTGAGLKASPGGAKPVEDGPGTRLGRYQFLERIGEGGFGSVYLAEQTEPVRRQVAVKIIKLGMDTRAFVARFEQERQALALMDHPHIARVFDAGASETGRPFFVMELVRGEPITAYCDRHKLDIPRRLDLFTQVCRAVQHAHQKGIIHRDLKPSNVLVTDADGSPLPKVIDFGIAKAITAPLTDKTLVTELHHRIGTLEYMSPEQAEPSSQDIDTRSDIYSLGVLLYELLTGTTPFDGTRLRESGYDGMIRILRNEEPPRPSLRVQVGASSSGFRIRTSAGDSPSVTAPSSVEIAQHRRTRPALLNRALKGDLDWIVMKCLEKERARRYETASALAEDIERHLAHQAVSATPPSRSYKLRKFVQRNRGAVAAGTAMVSTLLIAAVVSVAFGLSEARQRKDSEKAKTRAEKAEGEALARADELEKVASFQEAQLSGIDAQTMGVRIRKNLLEIARTAGERSRLTSEEVDARIMELEALIAGCDFTGLATNALDENFLQPTLSAIDEGFSKQPLVRARLLQTLATTLLNLGLIKQASAPQEEALAIRRRELGNEHPETLTSINKMGLLLQELGKLGAAEPYYREALDGRRRILGEEHRDTIASINNMGLFLQLQNKLAEAEPYCRDALEKYRRVLGNEDKNTLNAIQNMGYLLLEQGKLSDAEPFYREALERSRSALGEDHRDTIGSHNNMAVFLFSVGRPAEAEIILREMLEKQRRVLGNEHPDTLTGIINMGSALQLQGKREEAEPFFSEALEVCRRVLGEDHPTTLFAMNNLGTLLDAQGKLAEAEPHLRKALEIRRRILGDDNPDTLISVNNVAFLLKDQGRFAEAEALFREALERRRRVLGEDHPATLVSTHHVGGILEDQHKLAEAEQYRREALEKYRRARGDEHPETLVVLTNLGGVLVAQGESAEALELLAPNESAARRAFTGGNALGLGRFLAILGRARAASGEFPAAEANLIEAHTILSQAPNAVEKDPLTVLTGLTELYDAWHAAEPAAGHDAKAADWRAKLAAQQTGRRPNKD